jgi:hypothetical protein
MVLLVVGEVGAHLLEGAHGHERRHSVYEDQLPPCRQARRHAHQVLLRDAHVQGPFWELLGEGTDGAHVLADDEQVRVRLSQLKQDIRERLHGRLQSHDATSRPRSPSAASSGVRRV